MRIEHEGLQRLVLPGARRPDLADDGLQDSRDVLSLFGRDPDDLVRIRPEQVSDLPRNVVRLGCREVDLVQDRDDLQV
jgi:hypothetical protein